MLDNEAGNAASPRFRVDSKLSLVLGMAFVAMLVRPASAEAADPPPVVFVATGTNSYSNLGGSGTYATWATDSMTSTGFDYNHPDGDRATRSRAEFTESTMTAWATTLISRSSCCCTWLGNQSDNTYEIWVRGLPGVARYNLRIRQQGAALRSVSPQVEVGGSPLPSMTMAFNDVQLNVPSTPIDTVIDDLDASAAGPTREFAQYPGVTYSRARVIKAKPYLSMVQGYCACCGCCNGGNYSSVGQVDVKTTFEFEMLCEPDWMPGFSSGMNGSVSDLLVLPSGDVIAAGSFTSAGGVAANRIARWNGTSWSSLGSGMNDTVIKVAQLSDGGLIAVGLFTTAGGMPANRVARWNGSSWTALGAGVNGVVGAVAVLPNGNIVVAGTFTSAGGVPASNVAQWNGTAWSALGSGFNNTARTLAVLPNGDVVAGGLFTASGAVTVNYVARWNGSTWSAMGTGMNRWVTDLGVLSNGDLLAIGPFDLASGISANRIARWSGGVWSTLGAGVSATKGIAQFADGDILVGYSVTSGSVTTGTLSRWNGSAWFPYAKPLNNGSISDIAVLHDGRLLVAGSFPGNGGVADRIALWGPACQYCPADLNGDAFVDDVDFVIFAASYNLLVCSDPAMPANCSADVNNDDVVDDADFSVFVVAYDELVCP